MKKFFTAFFVVIVLLSPCSVLCAISDADQPIPLNGATSVSVDISELTWINGKGTVTNELYFGSDSSNLTLVKSGTLSTSYKLNRPLDYNSTYYWKVIEIDETGSTTGILWSFRTEMNPTGTTVNFYPQDVDMWTGNTAGTIKVDGEINTEYPDIGWAVFDISTIPPMTQIQSIEFWGFVNSTNFPFWSATPMGTVNPVTDDAATIFNQAMNNTSQGTAYIYSDESYGFSPGWHSYTTEANSVGDLQAAVDAGQGWFAMGFVDRDQAIGYYINFDGHSSANAPYLAITYVPIPVELTSFTANTINGMVQLIWSTATETNNRGFEIQRSSGSSAYKVIGFVQGYGTSTEKHSYSYTDKKVGTTSYTYRLRQVDFDGKSELSPEVSVDIKASLDFNLAQNYPNPFNPTTLINFNLRVDSKVSLNVFNILGQKVAQVVNGNFTAGNHQVTFDGSKLSTGVYFYRLQADGDNGSIFSSVKKMILTK